MVPPGSVGPDGLYDIVEAEAVLIQSRWIDANLVLQDMPADRENVGDARDGLELAFDDPIVDLPQVDVAVLAFGVRAFVEREIVDEHLPQARGDGPERRRFVWTS